MSIVIAAVAAEPLFTSVLSTFSELESGIFDYLRKSYCCLVWVETWVDGDNKHRILARSSVWSLLDSRLIEGGALNRKSGQRSERIHDELVEWSVAHRITNDIVV